MFQSIWNLDNTSVIANDHSLGIIGNIIIKRALHLSELAEILDSNIHRKIKLCIWFDKVNTSSCMCVFKEMLVDHSLNSEYLPNNIVGKGIHCETTERPDSLSYH